MPALLFTVTSFTRIIIVLGFVRNALGTPSMPPNQVIIGISLFLTVFVMAPTFTTNNDTASQPTHRKNKITQGPAFKRASVPLRDFMFKQSSRKDLALFTDLSKEEPPETRADVPHRCSSPPSCSPSS